MAVLTLTLKVDPLQISSIIQEKNEPTAYSAFAIG